MFVVVTIVFVIVRVAPGDPAAVMLGPDATPQDIADLRDAARASTGRSLVQYVLFLGQLARGDLGESIFLNRPVLTALAERAEPTFFLTLFSMLIASAIAIPIGIFVGLPPRLAVRPGGDDAWRCSPPRSRASGSASSSSSSSPSASACSRSPAMAGRARASLTRLSHLVLPAIALGIVSSALILRFTRASMLDVLGDDYVRTARSKGMGEFRVVMKHAFKNALIPILTVLGLTAALLVSGAVVTETVFGLPGVGSLVVSAVLRRDYPVIQGALLVIAALYVLINFLIDMLYLARRSAGAILMAAAAAASARACSLAAIVLRRRTVAFGLIILVDHRRAGGPRAAVAPYPPNRLSIVNRLKPPSATFWFGTDEFGRDVFSRTRLSPAGCRSSSEHRSWPWRR